MILVLGATVGGLVFFLVLMLIIITYVQAKKAKETRRSRLRHTNSSSRVQPFSNGSMWSVLNGPAPPAYGEIYSSPLSPPPAYCVTDPNPDPALPLPGRPQYMEDGRIGRQVTHVIQVHNAAGGDEATNNTNINNELQPSQRHFNNATPSSGRSIVSQRARYPTVGQRPMQNNNNGRNVRNRTHVGRTTAPVPGGGLPNLSNSTPVSGNVAPLSTQSTDRGVTHVARLNNINPAVVVPNSSPRTNNVITNTNIQSNENNIVTGGNEANVNSGNTLERRGSDSSVSVVSLPESTRSRTISMVSDSSGIESGVEEN